ncbi:acetyltransferase (GNAT) family protein [Roseibium hamelinense]|uniref:Acetyltransferase (GNAT) family protein n=1 Tax=Roseibium hamelinense TaxID=150831 RepID=A0A562STP4_9HYPH|nr:GNAT family N-acetyltransferase [Roseibium hamelinense]TWI84719.1 acetyltransferase (GNAT) family protein [Roseibium hamelinense]
MSEPVAPIRTQRLLLRPFVHSDADALFDYQSLEEVARYHYWEPRTREEIHRKLDDWVEMNALSGEGTLGFAICRADGGGLIGDISLRITNAEAGQAEIGFSLHPGRQGKGYAFEAASAFLEFGFGTLKLFRSMRRA